MDARVTGCEANAALLGGIATIGWLAAILQPFWRMYRDRPPPDPVPWSERSDGDKRVLAAFDRSR